MRVIIYTINTASHFSFTLPRIKIPICNIILLVLNKGGLIWLSPRQRAVKPKQAEVAATATTAPATTDLSSVVIHGDGTLIK